MRSASIAIVLLSCLAGGQPAFSQAGASAGIYGSVLDGQGAIVPRARITLLHVTTNQTRTAVSDQAGEYSFLLLPVGDYRITVEHPGFKKFQQIGILLQVNDNVKIDVRMELGEVSTEVKVESSAAIVETSTATIKETIDS